jgi:hypothetical protein
MKFTNPLLSSQRAVLELLQVKDSLRFGCKVPRKQQQKQDQKDSILWSIETDDLEGM